jgi:hypothetical protein
MNNTPTVILGKIYDRDEVAKAVGYEVEVRGETYIDVERFRNFGGDLALDIQYGESNWQRPCIGKILGSMDRYDEAEDIVLLEQHKWAAYELAIRAELRRVGLQFEPDEIKLYLRDSWG